MEKTYTTPKFELVRTDELNKVFFATSGNGPELEKLTRTTSGW